MILGIFSGLVGALTDPSILVNGLLIGGVYASMALGFTMIWGVAGVINLTQGELVMLGAFTTWSVMSFIGQSGAQGSLWTFILGLLVAMIALGVVGYLIQRVLINRIMGVSKFLTLLLTFGLAFVMQYSALLYWSATPRRIRLAVPGPNRYELFGAVIPAKRLLIFVFAVVLTVAFYLFLQRTRTGRAIRAASQNEQAAKLVGIDIDHIYGVTFAASAAVVAATGGLIGMAFSFQPQMGLPYTLKSFIVVVIGGLGSVIGALVGGILLGLIEQIGANIWGTSVIDAISFTALLVFLFVKPHGFFGEAEEGE
jgi:branched-chain amino acid transport system permease protein